MFECYLCGTEKRGYGEYFCPKCKNIQKIVELYGCSDTLDILEQTCLRSKLQQQYKINKLVTETDVSHPKPTTKELNITKKSLRKKESN